MEQTKRKSLIVYYSHDKSLLGEIALKLALDIEGDVYEIKTSQKLTEKELKKDDKKEWSQVSILYESIDFNQYNQVFIGGEIISKHLLGPLRQWIEQNKMYLLSDSIQLFYFTYCHDSHRKKNEKKIKRMMKEMIYLLGEPYRRIIITSNDYPFHSIVRKIGYHYHDHNVHSNISEHDNHSEYSEVHDVQEEMKDHKDTIITNGNDTTLLHKVTPNNSNTIHNNPSSLRSE